MDEFEVGNVTRVEHVRIDTTRKAQVYVIRGQNVMLNADLAERYGVPTKALVQAVKRNPERFPEDFMFQLNAEETEAMNRSQSVTGSQKHRNPRFLPFAFTEQGVAMLSSVLNSPRDRRIGCRK